MAKPQSFEEQIRAILDTETDAIRLSDALFRPDGLFAQMATKKEERRAIARSPLFKKAQQRVAELRRIEAASLSKSVEACQHSAQSTAIRIYRSEGVQRFVPGR